MMMKEMIFAIVLSLFLATFMADPVQADQAEPESEGENGAMPMEFGSCLIFMTSLMTILMSKMMN